MPQSGCSDHEILCDVDQPAGQVAGVGGLERRVREALARAVRRDEVLQDVQTLAEVRGDRRLDDRAVGLGHQAAHAGQLADLRRRTARARVRHHVDRVERLLAHLRALRALDLLAAELLHHRLGDLVVGARPDVDDLVVALAVGDETRGVLLLDLLHLVLGRAEDLLLLLGDDHVVDADRHAGTGRVVEARVHELVGEDHGLLQTERAVAGVDHARDRLLGHVLVDQVEGQALRQDLEQQRAADRGVDDAPALDERALGVTHVLEDAHAAARLEPGDAGLVGAVHFRHVGEERALRPGRSPARAS